MSNSEPILAEYLTREELASELRRNPRTLDRWEVLGLGPPRTFVGSKCSTDAQVCSSGWLRRSNAQTKGRSMSEGQGERVHTPFETGFGDLSGTPAPVQQGTPTVNTVVDAGEDLDVNLDARVAGLHANKATTNSNAISAFMRAVLPWPVEGSSTGWVNLHYEVMPEHQKAAHKDIGLPGYAFKTLDGFLSMAKFTIERPTFYRQFWQCMTMQKDCKGPNKTQKNFRAKRSRENAEAVKSLWIDLDLAADDPKKYPDEKTAMKAILVFVKKHNLPEPSVIVHSGNGLHMYWASLTVLTVDEWRPLAEGFKALLQKERVKIDPTVTADASRLMRLPTTENRKDLDNPKSVVLLTKTIVEYDFSTPPFQALKTHPITPPPSPPLPKHPSAYSKTMPPLPLLGRADRAPSSRVSIRATSSRRAASDCSIRSLSSTNARCTMRQ